jgi:hypothetical protein
MIWLNRYPGFFLQLAKRKLKTRQSIDIRSREGVIHQQSAGPIKKYHSAKANCVIERAEQHLEHTRYNQTYTK